MSVRMTRKVKNVMTRLADGPATSKELADGCNLSIMTLYPLADQLIDCGWITYDRKSKNYSITAEGKTVADQLAEDRARLRVRRGG